jgi:uncharacterized membrane protein (UPF0182 family)
VQQSFITNNQVRPDLTLFKSAESQAVFGNLLTLPIGGNGLLYVEPLYVQSTGQNSFPLLQKVLVNYGDRVGYGNTLAEALDQVFGAGAGQSATGNGSSGTPSPSSAAPSTTAPTTSPPSGGGGQPNPALDKAVSDIDSALNALATAQRNGDFAAIGQAQSNLQKAVAEYEAAKSSSGSSRSSASPSG